MRRAVAVLFFCALAAALAWSAAALCGISGATQLGRIRAAICVGSIALLFVSFDSIRRTKLKESYALLWVLPSLAMLAMTFFPGALDAVRRYFGMEYGSTMAGVAFLSLLAAVFAISRTISHNEDNITAIAQYLALLQERVRELEDAAGKNPSDSPEKESKP